MYFLYKKIVNKSMYGALHHTYDILTEGQNRVETKGRLNPEQRSDIVK